MFTTSNSFYNNLPSKQEQHNINSGTVTSLQELAHLIKSPNLTKSAASRVKIAIPELPGIINVGLEKNTINYLGSCGCKQGMQTGVILLLLQYLFRTTGNWMFENTILNIIIIFLCGAVAGKISVYVILRIKLAISMKNALKFISDRK